MELNSKKRNWKAREVVWEKDSELLMRLFDSTWTKHPITCSSYFNWNLIDSCFGGAVAFCAEPTDQSDIIAGVYLVLPNRLFLNGLQLDFSVSLYTMTHPFYYKQGIFKKLAHLAYDKCRKIGIRGVVGVPNNNSLPGFTKALSFDVIGKFDLLARFVRIVPRYKFQNSIKVITQADQLDGFDFSLLSGKGRSTTVFFDRSKVFLRWRFLTCPKFSYTISLVVDSDNYVRGLIAYRKAYKKKIPITVIMDFILDHNNNEIESMAHDLLASCNRFALSSLTPIIITLANPKIEETKLLKKKGFRSLSKRFLPHESNLILKSLDDLTPTQLEHLKRFSNWYFSFADFDLF